MSKILFSILLGYIIIHSYQLVDTSAHALYFSTIKIEHQEETANTSIDIKVFSDDLQNGLKHEFSLTHLQKKASLCADENNYVQQYFNTHLQIWINEKAYPLAFHHCKIINDIHLITFKIQGPNVWTHIKIEADFLMDLFPTQSNILQFHYTNNRTKTPQILYGRMMKGKEELEFSF